MANPKNQLLFLAGGDLLGGDDVRLMENLLRKALNALDFNQPDADIRRVQIERLLHDVQEGGAQLDAFSADGAWYVAVTPRGGSGYVAQTRERIARFFDVPVARLQGECILNDPDEVLQLKLPATPRLRHTVKP